MASALLCLLSLSAAGCLNPLFFDDVEVPVNHVPVFTNLEPEPGFSRLIVNVAPNCAPGHTFRAERLDDPDLDTLTVRWSLLLQREGTLEGAREVLREVELEPCNALEPCPPDNPETPIYDFTAFELDRTKLVVTLGAELTVQTSDPAIEGQLLELRVSDGGFKTGTDDVPDGRGLFFQSWAIKLVQIPEDC